MGSEFLFNNKAQQNLGKIDFTKIKSGLKKEEISSSNEYVKSLFDMLDKNSDGTLNREEILNLEQTSKNIKKDIEEKGLETFIQDDESLAQIPKEYKHELFNLAKKYEDNGEYETQRLYNPPVCR